MKTSIKLLEKDEDKSPKVPTLKVYRNPHVNEIDVNSPLHPAWRYTRIEPIPGGAPSSEALLRGGQRGSA